MVNVRNYTLALMKCTKKFSTYWMDGKGAQSPNVMVDKCACPTNCGLCT